MLPQSLDQISTYSVAFRKAIVSALPTSARIALWREQIAYYESAPGMSAKQQAFLASAGDRVANLVALSDAGASTDELAGPLAAFGNEAIQMFGKESALLMFANIGVNTPEEVTPLLAETPGFFLAAMLQFERGLNLVSPRTVIANFSTLHGPPLSDLLHPAESPPSRLLPWNSWITNVLTVGGQMLRPGQWGIRLVRMSGTSSFH